MASGNKNRQLRCHVTQGGFRQCDDNPRRRDDWIAMEHAPVSFLDSPFSSRAEYDRYVALAPEKREGFLRAATAAADLKREAAVTPASPAADEPLALSSAPAAAPEAVDIGDDDPAAAAASAAATAAAAAAPAAAAVDPEEESRAAYYSEFKPRFALGRGQFGVAYLLQHKDGSKAVDKRIQLEGLKEEDRSNTWKEIHLLRRLKHEGVVGFYHSYETSDGGGGGGGGGGKTLHILMEYCDGGALDEAIAEQKDFGQPFAAPRVRGWVLQIASALAYIHSERVIHRDLKTANIFLTGRDGELAKLGDFGISRLMSSQTVLANTQVGTPYYLSPELIIGQDGYDGRADVWSLGVILYELLAFGRPFSGDNLGMLALQITRRPPKPLPSGTPHELQELSLRCLNKEAGMRPTSRDLLHSEPLRTWLLNEKPTPTPSPVTATPSPVAPSVTSSATTSTQPTPTATPVATPLTTPKLPTPNTALAATTETPISSAASALALTTETPLPLPAGLPAGAASGSGGAALATPPAASASDHPLRGSVESSACGSYRPGDATMGYLDFALSKAPDGLRKLYQWGTALQKLSVGDVQEPHWHVVQDQKEELGSHEVTSMCVGENCAVALTQSGDVFSWKAPGTDVSLAFARTKNPGKLVGASGVRAVGVGLTSEELFLINAEGELHQWRMMGEAPGPVRGLPEGLRIVSIACGSEHCVACTDQGEAYSWGNNDYGQLGLDDQDDRSTPEKMELREGESVRAAACAKNYTILLMTSGEALSCGENEFRTLGRHASCAEEGEEDDEDEEADCSAELQPLALPRNTAGMLVSISCAYEHAAALTSDGRVVTWGHTEGGRLGRKQKPSSNNGRSSSPRAASADSHARPAAVKFAIPGVEIVSISAGGAHTLAVSAGGQLWLWGQISQNVSYPVPRLVLGPKLGHAFFLKAHAGEWLTLAVAVPPPQDFDDEGED